MDPCRDAKDHPQVLVENADALWLENTVCTHPTWKLYQASGHPSGSVASCGLQGTFGPTWNHRVVVPSTHNPQTSAWAIHAFPCFLQLLDNEWAEDYCLGQGATDPCQRVWLPHESPVSGGKGTAAVHGSSPCPQWRWDSRGLALLLQSMEEEGALPMPGTPHWRRLSPKIGNVECGRKRPCGSCSFLCSLLPSSRYWGGTGCTSTQGVLHFGARRGFLYGGSLTLLCGWYPSRPLGFTHLPVNPTHASLVRGIPLGVQLDLHSLGYYR